MDFARKLSRRSFVGKSGRVWRVGVSLLVVVPRYIGAVGGWIGCTWWVPLRQKTCLSGSLGATNFFTAIIDKCANKKDAQGAEKCCRPTLRKVCRQLPPQRMAMVGDQVRRSLTNEGHVRCPKISMALLIFSIGYIY